MDGKNYSIEIRTYQDHSNLQVVSDLATSPDLAILDDADFVLGAAVDDLNLVLAQFAQAAGKVMVTGGAGYPFVFEGRDTVFGTITPYLKITQSAVELAASIGAKTAWLVEELSPFLDTACAAIPQFGLDVNLTFLGTSTVGGREGGGSREGGRRVAPPVCFAVQEEAGRGGGWGPQGLALLAPA